MCTTRSQTPSAISHLTHTFLCARSLHLANNHYACLQPWAHFDQSMYVQERIANAFRRAAIHSSQRSIESRRVCNCYEGQRGCIDDSRAAQSSSSGARSRNVPERHQATPFKCSNQQQRCSLHGTTCTILCKPSTRVDVQVEVFPRDVCVVIRPVGQPSRSTVLCLLVASLVRHARGRSGE